jgi:hypothetical protein
VHAVADGFKAADTVLWQKLADHLQLFCCCMVGLMYRRKRF